MTFKIGGLYEYDRSDRESGKYGIYPNRTLSASAAGWLRLGDKFVVLDFEETTSTRVLKVLVAGSDERGFVYQRKSMDWHFQEVLTVEDKPDGNSV